MSRLFVPGPLPGLNEILRAKGARFRGGNNGYNKMKMAWAETVGMLAHAAGWKPEGKCFTYLFRERDMRRDPSNFVAGGVKLIEDALQDCGLLENDGWKQVEAFAAHWLVDKETPGATVFTGDCLLSKKQAIELDDYHRRSKTCRRPTVK